jgi:heavy metal efflux system protein
MELKSLQDWVISKYISSAPDVVDDSSFGGITREYQVRVDPDKLISYGLSLAQIEQQLTNANANAGGSFIEQGAQQVNVRAVGLVTNVNDIEKTVLKTQNGTAVRVQGHRRRRAGTENPPGPDRQGHSSLGRRRGGRQRRGGRHRVHAQGRRHGDHAGRIHAMVRRLNDHILPPGVKIVPYLDRDDLVITPRTPCCTTSPKA